MELFKRYTIDKKPYYDESRIGLKINGWKQYRHYDFDIICTYICLNDKSTDSHYIYRGIGKLLRNFNYLNYKQYGMYYYWNDTGILLSIGIQIGDKRNVMYYDWDGRTLSHIRNYRSDKLYRSYYR